MSTGAVFVQVLFRQSYYWNVMGLVFLTFLQDTILQLTSYALGIGVMVMYHLGLGNTQSLVFSIGMSYGFSGMICFWRFGGRYQRWERTCDIWLPGSGLPHSMWSFLVLLIYLLHPGADIKITLSFSVYSWFLIQWYYHFYPSYLSLATQNWYVSSF